MNKADETMKARMRPPATEGLTWLDQDRASSVADEGGASAAIVEAQETPAPAAPGPPRSGRKSSPKRGRGE